MITRCRSITGRQSIAVVGETTLTVQKELRWSISGNEGKRRLSVLVVAGKLSDKGREYPVEWEFLAGETTAANIAEALELIGEYLREKQRGIPVAKHLEMMTEVEDWLQVGWRDTAEGFHGAMRFSKAGETLEVRFADLPAMERITGAFH